MDMVRHYAEKHAVDNDHDLVFPAANGKWMCRRNWQRRGFNVACEEAGLVETIKVDGEDVQRPKYRPYDLRHFFASIHIEKGTNLKKLQTLIGHANIETTLNVYGHLLDDDENLKRPAVGMLSSLRGNSLRRVCGGGPLRPAEIRHFFCMGCKGSQARILSPRP